MKTALLCTLVLFGLVSFSGASPAQKMEEESCKDGCYSNQDTDRKEQMQRQYKHQKDTSAVQTKPGVRKQYTCPMHPEVVSPTPGRCPKCKMDLIEVKEAKKTDGKKVKRK